MFKSSLRAGFEPARGTPIGFRVQRLYLSAIAAMSFCATWRPLTLIQMFAFARYPFNQQKIFRSMSFVP